MNANRPTFDRSLNHGVPRAARYDGADEPPQAQSQIQSGDGAPKPKKILLADDDPGVREMLGRVLESENYVVTYAKNGREAAARFVADPPDLVLLDLNMPERDGWSAFNDMNVAQPMLPVIVITARPNQYSRAADLGVDGLMEKPLDLSVLLEAIHALLEESQSQRVRRLTDPRFKTVFLNQRANPAGNATHR